MPIIADYNSLCCKVLQTKPSINDYIHTKLLPDARIAAEFGGVCFFQKPMSQCVSVGLELMDCCEIEVL